MRTRQALPGIALTLSLSLALVLTVPSCKKGSHPAPAATTVPASPAELQLDGVTRDSVSLKWADKSNNEKGFRVDRVAVDAGGAEGPSAEAGKVAADVNRFKDSGLTPGTRYIYRVLAYNEMGESVPSDKVVAVTLKSAAVSPPAAPSEIQAQARSASSIGLSWKDNSNDEDAFQVERKLPAEPNFTTVATLPANTTSHEDKGLQANTQYQYRIKAYNKGGHSFSAVVMVKTRAGASIPNRPTDLTGSGISTSTVLLAWKDNSNNEDGFRLERSESTTTSYQTVASLPKDTISHKDMGLKDNTIYYYRMLAFNQAGISLYSDPIKVQTRAKLPATKIVLILPSTSSNGVYTLKWTVTGLSASNYAIQEDDNINFSSPRGYLASGGVKQYAFSGKSSGTYFYRVGMTDPAHRFWSIPASILVKLPTSAKIYATHDNLMMYSTTNANTRKQVFQSSEIAVGANWIRGAFRNDWLVAASAIRFDDIVSRVQGRSIRSAKLRLKPQILAADYHTQYQVAAFASNWSPSLLSWDVAARLPTYTSGRRTFNPPVSTLTVEVDITYIVQKWASGGFRNCGLLLTDASPTFPGYTAYRSTSFSSLEWRSSGVQRSYRPHIVVEFN